MAHGRGIYMCDRPGPCYKYGKILILSRVLCSSTAGDTLMVSRGTGSDTGTIYVIKKVENILPYCVINKHQTLGNGASTSNQTLIKPAHLSSPFQPLQQHLHAVLGSTNMAMGIHPWVPTPVLFFNTSCLVENHQAFKRQYINTILGLTGNI